MENIGNIEIKKEDGKIFSFIRGKWLVCKPEEEVRQKCVCMLVNVFGYSLDQMSEEFQVNNAHRGQGQARADIVVWKSEEEKREGRAAFIVVECKAENVKIHEEDYFQGFNYAARAGASFFITYNNREIKYFSVDKEFAPKKLNEIVTIPKAAEVGDEKRLKEILSQTKAFTREEFTKLLLKCHNIIRNNDKLSPEAAFDEISKLLFIKIDFERKSCGSQVFTLEQFNRQEQDYEAPALPTFTRCGINKSFMQELFEETKHSYEKDRLFEENELIKIRETSFKSILSLLEKYNLSDTSDDVKGIAFEKFLGTTFRGELGQFFTPRTIVDFMTEVLDPQEGELICDPCCGSGGFLIKAFDYIREAIEKDIQSQKEKFKQQISSEYPETPSEEQQIELNKRIETVFKKLNSELEHIHNDTDRQAYSRLDELSYHCIYGTDANPRMARTSKMNMIMHGDGHGGVYHHDGLINIDGIFEGRFDLILTNPPFGASVARDQYIEEEDIDGDRARIEEYIAAYGDAYRRQIEDLERRAAIKLGEGTDKKLKEEKSLLGMYEVGKMSSLTEVLFVERCLRLLKPGGRMGIVLPEGVLNNSNLQTVREFFESKAKIVLICSIPQDVFIKAGASVKPSLVFLKKFTEEESARYTDCVKTATARIDARHAEDFAAIERDFAEKKIGKKEYVLRKKILQKAIAGEVKPLVKEMFDYQIPIAKVNKAGITATGGVCRNELETVREEFEPYRKENRLWVDCGSSYTYELSADGTLTRRKGTETVVIGE